MTKVPAAVGVPVIAPVVGLTERPGGQSGCRVADGVVEREDGSRERLADETAHAGAWIDARKERLGEKRGGGGEGSKEPNEKGNDAEQR